MVAILNGRLDVATLVAVPGGLLRADAAAAWLRVRAAVGLDLRPTSWADTYRPYYVQERIFRERYTTSWVTGIDPRRWLGQTWWRLPGTASAAVPGTSNHGWGVAIDVTGLGGFTGSAYARLAEVAPAHGYSNRAGRQINEPWHWEYTPSTDTHPTIAQEDDMPLNAADLTAIQQRVNAALVSDIIRGTEFNAAVRAQASVAVIALIPTIAAALDAKIDDEALLALLREQQARNTTTLVPALTAAVIAALPPVGPGGADPAAIQAAAEAAIRQVLGSLD